STWKSGIFHRPSLVPGDECQNARRKALEIKAPALSDTNIYVKSVKLNGQRLTSPFISHSDFTLGGTLEFEMTDKPCDTFK
ncbi:MAG: glycoside hydrolase family 92 protein, partial [Duncaniella sp.]|nr:glycoside hydrolase family 92 protein [Duncaniella sp.]